MSHVKGAGWLSNKEYLIKTIGEDNLKKVINSLSPEDQAIFNKPILPITWIDYGAFLRVQIAADKMFGKGDFELVRQANAYGTRKDATGIYKVLFRILTPEFVITNAAKLWGQYYDVGKLEVIEKGRGRVVAELTGIPDIPLYHEYENLPSFEETLRLCNCKNVQGKHPKCMARGDQSCIFELSWE